MRRLDRPAIRIQFAGGPVDLDERVAQEELAVRPVQHVEKPVAIAPEHELARGAGDGRINEYRGLHRIEIVRVIRCELEMPPELAGIRVKCHDRVGVEVVARPLIRVPVRTGVADAPVGQVERRIVRPGEPD